ncbi:B12-binding domain-containing radical SAM protein [Pseudooceanicola sp.]|uniref:B12-binding domain-containing radical SAM protein n=1 Tax=Pseudooceanicola sp. TaxID=1914328 RepID=UPI0035C750A1
MKILIGQAYHLRLDPKNWQAMELYPPLGSLYAASVLRVAGHDIAFSDSMIAEDTDTWTGALEREAPDVALIYEDNFNYLTKMCLLNMRDAAADMIRAAKARGAVVVVAGSDASDVPEAYLGFGADVVILGEGEATLEELITRIDTTGLDRLEAIAGIVFTGPDGSVETTGKRRVIRNIDTLPAPAWDLIDMENYRQHRRAYGKPFELNVATSRGCPFHCNWCAKPIWGRVYHARSPEQTAVEFATLKTRAQPERIWVMDDIFAMKPGWARSFAEALEARDAHIPFKCLSRADLLLREGEVAALADAGCAELWIGAESGSQTILDAMEKGTDIAEIDKATRVLRDHGIKIGFFLQYGYPGEGWAEIRHTFALLKRNLPDKLGISVSYPLPGTPFHDRVLDRLGAKRNWEHSDDLDLMYRGPFNKRFYRVLHRYTHALLRWYKGTANPVMRKPSGQPDWPGSLRRLAGTARAFGRLALLAPVLHFHRLTSAKGMEALEPERSRADAGLDKITLGSGR